MLLPLQCNDPMVLLSLVATEGDGQVGGVEVRGGLPGLQPDGQVDEVPPAVDVCRGVLVGGGGKPVGQGESGDCQYV